LSSADVRSQLEAHQERQVPTQLLAVVENFHQGWDLASVRELSTLKVPKIDPKLPFSSTKKRGEAKDQICSWQGF
jgi:hypothetical protein